MSECLLCCGVEDRVLLKLPPCPDCRGASRTAARRRAVVRSVRVTVLLLVAGAFLLWRLG